MATRRVDTDSVDERLVVDVDTAVTVDELVARAAGARRVRIQVPSFTDGRVFSQVRALSETSTFDGEVEVHGDLLPDQLPLLEQYGVADIVLENGMDAADRPGYIRVAYRERLLRTMSSPRADTESMESDTLEKGVTR